MLTLSRHSGECRNLVEIILRWSVLGLVSMLTACSLPPSEDDIKAALESSLSGTNKVTSSIFGESGKVEIVTVKKIGCTKDGGGYTCDVEVTRKVPVVGETKSMNKMHLVKLDSGWSITQ